jgi:hypothetical protein
MLDATHALIDPGEAEHQGLHRLLPHDLLA